MYPPSRSKRSVKQIGVSEPFVDVTVKAILGAARTGEVGDGKIMVLPIEKIVRIRTGETGRQRRGQGDPLGEGVGARVDVGLDPLRGQHARVRLARDPVVSDRARERLGSERDRLAAARDRLRENG